MHLDVFPVLTTHQSYPIGVRNPVKWLAFALNTSSAPNYGPNAVFAAIVPHLTEAADGCGHGA